ncbi:MAG: tetratricopeptide repeat protein [Candidatus Krumholzibacteria bacterium]|nr:tetratricopeptide repeat protein [Candidatus Krumholzibacteria bacterium]MDH4338436.1 tetratricopeptide repeat protein [Candidatus Krumholzibacteria bacterium]MDH5271079.1 tetratricopeptide repeat protein [Candidatus Krumholzibacteria bacterium]MDH5627134.1 tetratricopeptide repeat protein [Candidatus Krumholzibacteria bacterium]
MKAGLLALVMLLWVAPPALAADDGAPLEAVFVQANQAYEAGDYTAAIEHYEDLAARGVVNADLFYNLGNAYFESGELGRAVLWYERARRTDPRHEDARANLDLARSMLRDKQLVVEQSRLRAVLLAWHRETTVVESAALATGFYLLLCLLSILFIFRYEPRVNDFLRRMSIVSPGRLFGLAPGQDVALAMSVVFVVGSMFAGSSWVKIRDAREQTHAVIVAGEVSVFSGPSRDATVQFKVHEGTAVSVRESRPGWLRVDLSGDLSGWIDAGALERI